MNNLNFDSHNSDILKKQTIFNGVNYLLRSPRNSLEEGREQCEEGEAIKALFLLTKLWSKYLHCCLFDLKEL